MASVKVAVTIEQETLARVDSLVARRIFPSRSRAIQVALQEKLERQEGSRLAAECAKLDPAFERAMGEEGVGADVASWPEY
jgi:metal-responsive CopG/Arc/MetJ family transcriptional regulator